MILALANATNDFKVSSEQVYGQIINLLRGSWELVHNLGVNTTDRSAMTKVYDPGAPPSITETRTNQMISHRLNASFAMSHRQGVNARYTSRIRASAAAADRRRMMYLNDIDYMTQAYIGSWETDR